MFPILLNVICVTHTDNAVNHFRSGWLGLCGWHTRDSHPRRRIKEFPGKPSSFLSGKHVIVEYLEQGHPAAGRLLPQAGRAFKISKGPPGRRRSPLKGARTSAERGASRRPRPLSPAADPAPSHDNRSAPGRDTSPNRTSRTSSLMPMDDFFNNVAWSPLPPAPADGNL